MNKAFLCLGANLGNGIETFARACTMLSRKGISIICYSGIYTSPAWGMEQAPDFQNQVLEVETSLAAPELLALLLATETELGRTRSAQAAYVSRTLDIDILFFNEETIDQPGLHVPHPRLHLRRFVLEPLNEIAPGLVHPLLKKTVRQLLEECPDKADVHKISHAL
jgi:2-amino-4-hydroxy-6-hydroxymethyldihydropteridine diphosphokinase